MQEQGLKVSLLASGSSGNATYIETPKQKILVDCGLTGKAITAQMEKIDRSISDVDAILVTHEHSDHIKGIGVLARKYGIPIYANEKTWQAMAGKIGKVALEQQEIFNTGETLTFGDLDVMSFAVSHDAAAPQFYSFQMLKSHQSENLSFISPHNLCLIILLFIDSSKESPQEVDKYSDSS